MLRSKKDVDRHVRDVFTKVRNEAERKLRGYNIARFYHNVGEHEIARGYLSQFLSVRPKAIDAHRLMGQIHEASGNAEKAVLAYKTAYELGDGQKDLVIKICELYCDVPCDVSVLMHWAEEGQRLCPHHETITKLRSTIISNSSDSNSRANLQELYLDQIKVNPTSADLQSSLVRLYLDWSSEDPRKLDEAYNYVCEVEARRPFTHSLLWYQTLLEVADRYEQQGGRAQGVEFHSWVVTALDRLVHLTLTAASASAVSFNSDSNRESYLTDAANILQRFDKKLTAVKKMNCKRELEEAMSGQLVFHLAQYVMISGKRTNLIRNPNMLSCLLLHACIGPPPDATSHPYFHKLACYRMSQSYHILHSVARDSNVSPSTLINKVRQQCSNRESKEEAFKAVFGSRVASDQSYFLHHSGYGEQELSIPSSEDAKVFDQVVSTSESSQLREIVWLYLQGILRSAGASSPSTARNASLNLSNLNTSHNSSAVGSGSNNANLNSLVNSALHKNQPYYPYKLFDGMQFATSHLNSAVADSLCHLDCLAFLAATIFCELENGVCSGSVRSAVCKTSVCSGWLLHTPQQEEWWTSAHDLFLSSSRRSALAKGVGKCRQIVQKGLEAVRILGTGGVSVPLAVHIARCFTHWASSATDDADVSISEVTALEERAEHCWQRVLSMCGSGKMSTPSSVHTPRNLLFSTTRYDLGALKLEEVEEEGRLFLAKRLIKTGLRQEALQALGQLKSPEASFQRAMVYKQQANEMASAVSGDFKLFTNEQRGQHTLYLTQARDTLYLTLDRLRMPGVDRNHPLNAALSAEMTNVERALTAITADAINASYLEADGESEPEPLSPIRHNVHDTSVGGESFLNGSNYNTTPARSHRVTSTLRLEARPSPERLDAQVRHLTSVQEQTLQNLCEQNAALRNQNSALRDTCNAVSSQVKENAQLFRTILENNKSMSLDCYYNILTEIKTVSSSVKDLQDEVQKLKLEVSEIKAVSNKRPDETDGRLEGLPAHPTPPSHQSMLSNLYMGCFAGQVGAGGVPHPLLPPQSSMLPGHAPHGSPFLPPATLAESAYMSGSNAAGLHVNRIMSGMSTMSSASDTCTASPSVTRVHFQELPSLTAPQAPAVVDSAPTGLLPAPYGASTAVSVASGTLSGILSTPYGTPTSSSALPGLLAPTYASTSSSSTATATAPHNYQIPLPVSSLSGTAPFPRQSSDRPSSMIPTAGLLASVPPPIYSAVTPDNSALPVGLHGATTSTSLPTTAPGVSLQTMVLGGTGLTPVSTPLPATPLALTGKVKTIPQRDLRQDVSEPASGAAGASGDLSTLSNTSNEYYHDDGHDPCPDFVPVVPLPAKVEVCTGEEDEQVLFEDRARLYRMSSKEWKERGTGVIKVLHNSPKKTVRVLMRRDQTYKICANHFVTPALQLMKLQKQDDVWLWAAQDFADEELTSETFCCRFKTVEVASRFNRAITEAKMLASDYLKESSSASAETPVKSTPSTAKPLSELFKKPLGSWTCSTCCVVNTASAASCIACSSSNPKAPTLVEGCATTSNGALDLSGNSGGFKFGLQTTTSVAPPVFSSVLPAKGSGSITFGISGQTSVSKASPFSTPTPTLFSTPVSKTGFSIGFSKDDTPSTLFVTPNSTKSELNNTVTTVVPVSSFNTPSQTSLFSTPFASVTTAQLTPSSPFSAATTNTTAATSLFGTPVTSTKFSVAPPASGIFAPASSVPEASSATATATTAQSKTVFGGFSFTSTPSIATPKEEKEVKKEEAPKKPSIFSSFTFAANAAESGISSSPFTFKKEDASGSTVSTGGLFSNFKASDTLTFGALAGDSSALGASDVFKTKDADAFKPKPLFAGNTSRNNVSANANESSEKVEEFEPEIHFEPVIPLPELVQVKTGEEDEEEMFCERAKLFRWADATKEWKERGLGDIKILSNTATGKIRVLMRREKTLKICANHYITPDLSLCLWNDSDKALMWVANDFADGEMVRELFVVKFKSPEFASAFKGKFEKAQQLLRDRSAEPSTEETNTLTKHTEPKDTKTLSLMDKFRPAAGSWECDTCLLRNKPDSVACASCQTLKPGASASDVAPTANTTSFSFGINSSAPAVSSTATGFSASAFTFGSTSGSTPSFSFGLPASKAATSVASSTTALTSIANASFTFKPSTLASKDTNLTDVAKGQSGFKFGSPEKFEFSFKPRPPRSRDTSHCESEDGVVEEDEGDHLYFEPVVPLPDKVDVVTGEEEEVEVYCHRAKLFRKAGPEWKERGLGDVKILRHRDTGRVRLLMRREQVHKICLNHYLTENIKFNDKDEKSFYWVAQDYSEDTPSLETFAIRFKTPEVAQKFKKAAADALSQASAGVPTTEEAASSKDQTNGTDAATTEASGVVRARKLLLPDEFFAFENSEERCSGCIGCKVDTLQPFLQPETPCGNVLKDFPRDQFPRTPSFAAHSVFGSKAGDGIPAKPLFGSTPSVSSASLSFGSAPSRSLFGGASAPDSDTSKSGVFSGPSVGSIFGSTTASVFGGTSASSDSVFGGAGAAGSQPSIFGGAASGSEKPSIFKASVTTPGTSLFDGIAAGTTTSGTTFFGGATPSSVTSLFGGAVSSSSTSVFGGSPAANASGSLFDASKTSTSQSVFGGTLNNFSSPAFGASGPTVFGAVSTTPQTFDGGNSKASSSLFVNPTVSESTPSSLAVTSTVAPSKFGEGSTPTAGTLFGGSSTAESKGFISFADITAEKDGFKSKASTVDMSAWQAKPLFASLNKSNNQSKDDSSDQLHHEEDSHDPHFEPVIPMPDLVEVKTGEENLEVIYSHRSKTFRYDNSTKEWKERGLGDIKILYDPASQKYRLLQRREQIHKLAVHHYLMPGQKLTPLASSETAWCWYAQDFSEDSQGSREQLAAKFKNADVAKEFKTKFEECVAKVEQLSASGGSNSVTAEKLISGSTTTVQSVSSAGIGQPTVLLKKPQQYTSDTESSETGDEDEEDDEDDYVDSSIMFEKACQLEKRLGENWDILGTVILRIVYESDSDGARLMATDEGDLLLLDHIISTDLTYEDLEGTAVSWAAHDLSTQPACHVKLRATFNDDDDKEIFIGTLEEGREFANKGGTTDEDIDAEDEAVACDPKLANAISEMLSEMKK